MGPIPKAIRCARKNNAGKGKLRKTKLGGVTRNSAAVQRYDQRKVVRKGTTGWDRCAHYERKSHRKRSEQKTGARGGIGSSRKSKKKGVVSYAAQQGKDELVASGTMAAKTGKMRTN